jgi:hypothetical protein
MISDPNVESPLLAQSLRLQPGSADADLGGDAELLGSEVFEEGEQLVARCAALRRKPREQEIRQVVFEYVLGRTTTSSTHILVWSIKPGWVQRTGKTEPTLAEVMKWEERMTGRTDGSTAEK